MKSSMRKSCWRAYSRMARRWLLVRHRAVCCPHDLLDDLDLLWICSGVSALSALNLPVLPHKLGEIPHDVTAKHLQDVLG